MMTRTASRCLAEVQEMFAARGAARFADEPLHQENRGFLSS